MRLDVVAGRFQQFAILHAAGTDGFASAAAQTEIKMLYNGSIEGELRFFQRPHQINATARRIIFVPRLKVSWTGGQTEPAMNAG